MPKMKGYKRKGVKLKKGKKRSKKGGNKVKSSRGLTGRRYAKK